MSIDLSTGDFEPDSIDEKCGDTIKSTLLEENMVEYVIDKMKRYMEDNWIRLTYVFYPSNNDGDDSFDNNTRIRILDCARELGLFTYYYSKKYGGGEGEEKEEEHIVILRSVEDCHLINSEENVSDK